MSNGKIPGHEVEIEQHILGCMQVDLKVAQEIARELSDVDFTDSRTRQCFSEFKKQVMDGYLPDFTSCSKALQQLAMDSLAQCPTPANSERYVLELLSASRTRAALAEAQQRIREIEQGHYRPQIQERTQSCQENEVSEQIEQEISGKRECIKFPGFPSLDRTQCLLPGTVTILCGSPGASKSLVLKQMSAGFHCLSSIMELEDTTSFHLRRLIAMEAGEANLTRDWWCRKNEAEARRIIASMSPRVRVFKENKLIQTPAPNQAPTIDFVVNWAEDEARRGVRVIGIDPVSMVEMRGAVWEGNKKLVMGLKRVAEQYGVSIITVNHPVGGKAGIKIMPSLENIAGGQSWQRFTHTVLWLEACHMAETEIDTPPLPVKSNKAQYNRVLHILKSRMGMGAGQRIACLFDSKTLRHSEIGVMV